MLKIKYKSRLLRLFSLVFVLLIFTLSVNAKGWSGQEVYLGGYPFGLRIDTDGVFVVDVSEVDSTIGRVSPAKDADIRAGDVILNLNGEKVDTVEEVSDIINSSKGKRLTLEIKRNGSKLTKNLIPVLTSDKSGYKSGLWIKDDTAGIGTITYFLSDKQSFGGLGHGICDRTTLEILPLREGTVHKANITSIQKGNSDLPGELKGNIDTDSSGSLLKNTEKGVFGKFDSTFDSLEKIKVADSSELKVGECTIYSTLSGNTPTAISGEITKIIDRKSDTKNFLVKVTDKEVLEKAGGIVQGMSGSPIVQNGRLVGAVTHVLMRDQSYGYGILIENMLSE